MHFSGIITDVEKTVVFLLTCMEHSITETAMTASSMVTVSLYMSLACAVRLTNRYFM